MLLSILTESNVDRFKLLQGMVYALSKGKNDAEKVAQINAFLFNHGVREFGGVGEQVKFDTSVNEIVNGSPLPGDMVKVVSSGYKDMVTGYILKKADIEQI